MRANDRSGTVVTWQFRPEIDQGDLKSNVAFQHTPAVRTYLLVTSEANVRFRTLRTGAIVDS